MTTLRLATQADDATLREILRANGMRTWVDMAVAREPSFFAGAGLGGKEWAVIAEEASQVVGMYTAAMRRVYLDGKPECLGYLGSLRVRSSHRHRIRHLRGGYASVRTLAHGAGTIPWWFTVIAAENSVARRLLERGVRGLPAYVRLGDYVTCAIPVARGRRAGMWRRAAPAEFALIIAFHNARAARFDFAPQLDEELVRRVGHDNFFVLEVAGALRGVAALWDQRAFKQIIVNAYRPPIGALLPVYNLYARLARRIPLPRVGQALDQSFIAFLALDDELLAERRTLLGDLLSHCQTPVASLGLHAGNPLIETVAAFKPVKYPACIYGVSFDARQPRRSGHAQPEAALL
jgi:hypothetical protein